MCTCGVPGVFLLRLSRKLTPLEMREEKLRFRFNPNSGLKGDRYLVSGRIFVQISGIRLNIFPHIRYLSRYSVSNGIFVQITGIRSNICTSVWYLAGYMSRYPVENLSRCMVSGRIFVQISGIWSNICLHIRYLIQYLSRFRHLVEYLSGFPAFGRIFDQISGSCMNKSGLRVIYPNVQN